MVYHYRHWLHHLECCQVTDTGNWWYFRSWYRMTWYTQTVFIKKRFLYAPYLKMIRYLFSTHAFICGGARVPLNRSSWEKKTLNSSSSATKYTHARTHPTIHAYGGLVSISNTNLECTHQFHDVEYVGHIDWLSFRFDLYDANFVKYGNGYLYKSMINHTNAHTHRQI